MVRDQIRPDGMGGIFQCASLQASHLATRRVAQEPPPHMWSSLGSSGRPRVKAVTSQFDSRE
jgi:hypothetical protein